MKTTIQTQAITCNCCSAPADGVDPDKTARARLIYARVAGLEGTPMTAADVDLTLACARRIEGLAARILTKPTRKRPA